MVDAEEGHDAVPIKYQRHDEVGPIFCLNDLKSKESQSESERPLSSLYNVQRDRSATLTAQVKKILQPIKYPKVQKETVIIHLRCVCKNT